MKKLVGHLYFIYGLTLFSLSMFVVVIPVWILTLFPEPGRSKGLHRVFRAWMGLFMPLVFCPVTRRGKQYFKKGEPYVVVVNHQSLVDIPVTSPWIPGPNKTLAKVEMSRIPLFGLIYTAGSILVDRKKSHSRRDSFTQMHQTLELGMHLCLYPEGTRNKSDRPLLPFYDGAFVIAIKSQRPIIPALIFNTGRILPHNRTCWAWPYRIHLHFLEPIETKGKTTEDVATLKAEVFQRMESYYLQHRKKA